MSTTNTPDYSNHAFDPSEIGNTIHQHKMLQNQVRPEAVSNTPFEDGLDEIFTRHNLNGIGQGGLTSAEAKAALTQLHKAAIVAELEALPITEYQYDDSAYFDSGVDKSDLDARIEQYKKEGK